MSDTPALSLASGALDRFCAWIETRRPVDLLACAVLGALATLAKPQAATFALVMLYLGFLEFRWRLFTRFSLYMAALAMALPATLAIRHSAALSRAGGPPVIGAGLIGRSMELWLQAATWREQWHRLSHPVLGPVALLLCVAGLLWPLKHPKQYLFHVWFLSTALFLFLIPRAIVGWNDYYLLLLVPASAGLIGIAMRNLCAATGKPAVAIFLSLALIASSVVAAGSLFRTDKLHYRAGTAIRGLTQPGDLIATSAGGAPDPLYFSGRRGWEAGRFNLARLETLAAAGAKVFAIADPDAIRYNTQVVQQADQRFLRLTPVAWSDWIIWSLDQADLLPASHVHDRSQNPPAGNFGGAIDLHDMLCREILRSPAALEVSYRWQCLKKIDANLRALVHVTTPAGQIVLQQDHWPVAGHRMTLDWNAGEFIRERFVVLLPEGQMPGRYQLRIGWFDPRNGIRLSYQGEAADGENRAIVAEFDVHRKPPAGFFSSE